MPATWLGAPHHDQWRAVAAVHNQPIGGAKSRTRRAKDMEIGGFFGVESMQGGRSAKANRHRSAARQVEPA